MTQRVRVSDLLKELDVRILNVLIAMFLLCILVAGVYDVFVSEPIAAIEQGLAGPYYTTWSIGNIITPLLWFVGAFVAHPLPWFRFGGNKYASLMFQFAGTAGYAAVSIIYVWTTFAAAYWGKGVYAAFGWVGLAMCFVLLAARDGWRLVSFERPARDLRDKRPR